MPRGDRVVRCLLMTQSTRARASVSLYRSLYRRPRLYQNNLGRTYGINARAVVFARAVTEGTFVMQDVSSREHQWISRQAQSRKSSGQLRLICPWCSPARTKQKEPCLSVNVTPDGVAYSCWHCDEQGFIPDRAIENNNRSRRTSKPKPIIVAGELSEASESFLRHRGIHRQAVADLGLFTGMT